MRKKKSLLKEKNSRLRKKKFLSWCVCDINRLFFKKTSFDSSEGRKNKLWNNTILRSSPNSLPKQHLKFQLFFSLITDHGLPLILIFLLEVLYLNIVYHWIWCSLKGFLACLFIFEQYHKGFLLASYSLKKTSSWKRGKKLFWVIVQYLLSISANSFMPILSISSSFSSNISTELSFQHYP